MNIAACIPTDLKNLGVPLDQLPPPPPRTDLYITGKCNECGCGIWIGPRQRVNCARFLCMLCAAKINGQHFHLGGGPGIEGNPIH